MLIVQHLKAAGPSNASATGALTHIWSHMASFEVLHGAYDTQLITPPLPHPFQ